MVRSEGGPKYTLGIFFPKVSPIPSRHWERGSPTVGVYSCGPQLKLSIFCTFPSKQLVYVHKDHKSKKQQVKKRWKILFSLLFSILTQHFEPDSHFLVNTWNYVPFHIHIETLIRDFTVHALYCMQWWAKLQLLRYKVTYLVTFWSN